ncbi:hypothetical protein Hanom_Chr15g01410861 [Helianthus anomalus]
MLLVRKAFFCYTSKLSTLECRFTFVIKYFYPADQEEAVFPCRDALEKKN